MSSQIQPCTRIQKPGFTNYSNMLIILNVSLKWFIHVEFLLNAKLNELSGRSLHCLTVVFMEVLIT